MGNKQNRDSSRLSRKARPATGTGVQGLQRGAGSSGGHGAAAHIGSQRRVVVAVTLGRGAEELGTAAVAIALGRETAEPHPDTAPQIYLGKV